MVLIAFLFLLFSHYYCVVIDNNNALTSWTLVIDSILSAQSIWVLICTYLMNRFLDSMPLIGWQKWHYFFFFSVVLLVFTQIILGLKKESFNQKSLEWVMVNKRNYLIVPLHCIINLNYSVSGIPFEVKNFSSLSHCGHSCSMLCLEFCNFW